MEQQEQNSASRDELLQNIRRLSLIILDRLETGSREKRLDANETRFLGSISLRAMRLWKEALEPTEKQNPELATKLDNLAKTIESMNKTSGKAAT